MKWENGRRSNNVEDRRGRASGKIKGGGIAIIVIVLIGFYFGYDLTPLLDQVETHNTTTVESKYKGTKEEEKLADFVSVVLADTEDTWHMIFKNSGKKYNEPKLVLFTGMVKSACGSASSAVGPFYCPADKQVYIDLGFYKELKYRFKAPGDFAQAYVIAHEVGHHIQNLMGTSGKVFRQRQKLSKVAGNKLSVKLELQADCYAGIWAHHAQRTRNILEKGDLEEALNAASSIGDDRLQKQSRGKVVPDSFTHGTSKQRVYWFKRGFDSGNIEACNTFNYIQ